MEKKTNNTAQSEYTNSDMQKYIELTASILSTRYGGEGPRAFLHTYGCQGNVADSERIKGLLREMGYDFCDRPEEADLVLFNTCAVREHAEDRVYGNIGALKPIKALKPDMIIAVCGCMMQQEHVEKRIRESFSFVNLVFGTFAVVKLPELLFRVLSSGKRVFETTQSDSKEIAEGLPIVRDRQFKGWLPIMYGCDNFCSYCVVPYVRGRERSRKPEEVLREARSLIESGAKDITLLGQNVNSYGKNLEESINFSALLREISSIPGDFILRFMTSHPKDCSQELLETMASSEKIAKHLHLPFQSGSNRILSMMNRGYTREKYISLIEYAREIMPDLSVTSDIIVGFPGETYDDFRETLSLVEELKFTSLFTFIFSKRTGTKAAAMDDVIPYSEKSKWFKELTDLQETVASERSKAMNGKVFRVLIEELEQSKGLLSGRTEGNVSILFEGDESLIGTFQKIRVTRPKNWILYGEIE